MSNPIFESSPAIADYERRALWVGHECEGLTEQGLATLFVRMEAQGERKVGRPGHNRSYVYYLLDFLLEVASKVHNPLRVWLCDTTITFLLLNTLFDLLSKSQAVTKQGTGHYEQWYQIAVEVTYGAYYVQRSRFLNRYSEAENQCLPGGMEVKFWYRLPDIPVCSLRDTVLSVGPAYATQETVIPPVVRRPGTGRYAKDTTILEFGGVDQREWFPDSLLKNRKALVQLTKEHYDELYQ